MFLHGFPFDHNEKLEHLLPALIEANRISGLPAFDFVHFNDVWASARCFSSRQAGISHILGLDEELLNLPKDTNHSLGSVPHVSGVRCYSSIYCCGQFMVSRSAVLSRPKKFYQLALKLVLDRRECRYSRFSTMCYFIPYVFTYLIKKCFSSIFCSSMENLWHAIFRNEAQFTGMGLAEYATLL